MKNHVVLIADDNISWCQTLKAHIEAIEGFQVLQPSYDGGVAIESIKTNRPDIIILDFILPIYDGLYIVNYIHRKMEGYQPFIYVLSAIGVDKTNKIMRNINADYYSIKPITAEAVSANLSMLVQEHLVTGASMSTPDSPPRRESTGTISPPQDSAAHQEALLAIEGINVEKQVDDYLYELGAPLYRISTRCLRLALRFALEDDALLNSSMRLYEKISRQPDIKANSVGAIERNIRTTIKVIQETATPYFITCFPKRKKSLTNTEFLQSSAYILRMRIEGFLSDKISVGKNSDLRV